MVRLTLCSLTYVLCRSISYLAALKSNIKIYHCTALTLDHKTLLAVSENTVIASGQETPIKNIT